MSVDSVAIPLEPGYTYSLTLRSESGEEEKVVVEIVRRLNARFVTVRKPETELVRILDVSRVQHAGVSKSDIRSREVIK